jgi:hypothetical protein
MCLLCCVCQGAWLRALHPSSLARGFSNGAVTSDTSLTCARTERVLLLVLLLPRAHRLTTLHSAATAPHQAACFAPGRGATLLPTTWRAKAKISHHCDCIRGRCSSQ